MRAFRTLQRDIDDVRLVVVGSGPLIMKHKLWVRKEELSDKIFFAGRVSDEELPSYYTGADVYCSPAIGGESFGIVLLEAMASGTPLVASDNLGYREVLRHCPISEALVPPTDSEALANNLGKLIKDIKLREDLRRWGLQEVKQYDWSLIANQVADFYSHIAKNRS